MHLAELVEHAAKACGPSSLLEVLNETRLDDRLDLTVVDLGVYPQQVTRSAVFAHPSDDAMPLQTPAIGQGGLGLGIAPVG